MKAAVLYSDGIREYDLGHVLTGDRFTNFITLYHRLLGKDPRFYLVEPDFAGFSDLELVHTRDYIERVECLEGRDPMDTPLSPGLVRAAKLLAGAGKRAGELVHSGACEKAFVIGGGVQHARRDHEKGFGVFSDVGICAENLMQNRGVSRVLILDTDAHAGDGIYRIFEEDSRVLYVSIHQDPHTLYPGEGFINEIGTGKGKGFSANIPLPPMAGEAAYVYALEEIFVPLAREFQPEIILMIDGCDPHFTDRITCMGLTLEGIMMIGRVVGRTAAEVCGGKVVDFTGSGYSSYPEVVSLGWLSSLAGLTGVDMDLKEPHPPPETLDRSRGLGEVRETVRNLKKILGSFWKAFRT